MALGSARSSHESNPVTFLRGTVFRLPGLRDPQEFPDNSINTWTELALQGNPSFSESEDFDALEHSSKTGTPTATIRGGAWWSHAISSNFGHSTPFSFGPGFFPADEEIGSCDFPSTWSPDLTERQP